MKSEFKYVRKFRDSFDHIMYECKCSVCGEKVLYRRAIHNAPRCTRCVNHAITNKLVKERFIKGYESALYDICSNSYDHIATDEMYEGADVLKFIEKMCKDLQEDIKDADIT